MIRRRNTYYVSFSTIASRWGALKPWDANVASARPIGRSPQSGTRPGRRVRRFGRANARATVLSRASIARESRSSARTKRARSANRAISDRALEVDARDDRAIRFDSIRRRRADLRFEISRARTGERDSIATGRDSIARWGRTRGSRGRWRRCRARRGRRAHRAARRANANARASARRRAIGTRRARGMGRRRSSASAGRGRGRGRRCASRILNRSS